MPEAQFPWGAAAAFLLGGYLLGSVSFALVVGRLKGVDLRSFGSGNPGATNAGRALGRGVGALVYILDTFKGWAPAWLATMLFDGHPGVAVAGGVGAILGHCFPVWYGFQGGKGVATYTGVILALDPVVFLMAAVPFLGLIFLTRYMSVASMALGFLVFGIFAFSQGATPVLIFTALSGPFLIFTHRDNVARLLNGKESKLGSKVTEHG